MFRDSKMLDVKGVVDLDGWTLYDMHSSYFGKQNCFQLAQDKLVVLSEFFFFSFFFFFFFFLPFLSKSINPLIKLKIIIKNNNKKIKGKGFHAIKESNFPGSRQQ